ncbi:MAG: radical SAM protein [Candidatus Shapirobacteria bacterium]
MTNKSSVVLYFPTPFPYHRPWKGVPLAVLAISRVLDKEGYNIKIYAPFLQKNPLKELLNYTKKHKVICLGVSTMTGFQIHDGLKISRSFKNKFKNIPIVWGGWHPSILPTETVKNKYIDIVVRGQGDETFPKLVHSIEDKKSLRKINGLTYKSKGKIISTPDSTPVNLNTLPPIPYHLIDISKCLFGTEYGQKTIPYISSYGCPHRCGFCVEEVVNKRHWTSLSAQQIFNEWRDLSKKYSIDSVAVYDSNFFVNENRVNELCKLLIKNKLKIKWGNANGRVRQLSQYKPETWELMKKTGCAMILTGAESGNQKALNLISKDMNVDEIIKFTKLCHKYKIKILYSFLVGLPWSKDSSENKEFVGNEYKSTLTLIDKLLKISTKNRYTYYVFLPYPGAPLFHRAVSFGYKPPTSLTGWSNYLMSPEDAFQSILRQKWISPKQATMTAMLTQYIFGLMDQDTIKILQNRISSKIGKTLFNIAYTIGLKLVKLRWKYKYFDFPLDYWLFTQVHKYAGLI